MDYVTLNLKAIGVTDNLAHVIPITEQVSKNSISFSPNEIRSIPASLQVEDAVEDDEREAWATYKLIEPLYSITNRLLAES